MQGMMVMLMAVSGLGCHHGQSGHAASACYDACYASHSGCYDDYAATAYSACYDGGGAACYSSCFAAQSSCYTYDSCYVPEPSRGHGCGLFRGLKKLFGKHHRSSCYDSCYGGSCYSAGYDAYDAACYSSCYGQAVFGSYTPVYSGGSYGIGPASYGSAQGYSSPQGTVLLGSPTKGMPMGTSQGYTTGAPQSTYTTAPQATAPAVAPEMEDPAAEAPAVETPLDTPTPPAAEEPAPPTT